MDEINTNCFIFLSVVVIKQILIMRLLSSHQGDKLSSWQGVILHMVSGPQPLTYG